MKNYEKIEQYNTEATDILSNNYKTIIENLGEDVTREGLEKTPERVAKAMQYLTRLRIRSVTNFKIGFIYRRSSTNDCSKRH
jgi:GTP cyclohydrolase I